MIFRQSLGGCGEVFLFLSMEFPLFLSFFGRREEESRKHKVDVTEILRFALDDI